MDSIHKNSFLSNTSLSASDDAILGPKIDHGTGFVYEALLDNRIETPLENNDKVKTGYLRVYKKNSDKQNKDHKDRFILFYNNNNFPLPSPTLVSDSIEILEFDIYRLYIYGVATEIAMNIRNANSEGTELVDKFFSEKLAEIVKSMLVIKHHGQRVLPPSNDNRKILESGTAQLCGYIEGYDHILIDGGKDKSEILMYINTKLNHFTAYDKVAYDLATVNIPGARINIAINIVKEADGKASDNQSQNQGGATHTHDHPHPH